MGSRRPHFTDGTVQDRKRTSLDRGRQYQYEPCTSEYPVLGANPYALPTGATGTPGRVMFPGGAVEMFYLGAGQTLLGPTITANGLSVALDQTDDEGVEYIFSDYTAVLGERHDHVVGDESYLLTFGKISFTIATVAGSDEIAFGLRKVEAGQAAIASYDELTCLLVNAGDVFRYNILNGTPGTPTDTGFDWADGETHELSFIQDANNVGKVELAFDGEKTGVVPFSFDSGEEIQPFFRVLQDAGLTEVYWQSFELGPIRNVEKAV